MDYLLVCPSDTNMQFIAGRAPEGLIGEIIASRPPAWLEPTLVASPAAIYRIRTD